MYFSESLLFIMYPAQFSDNLLQWEIIKNAILQVKPGMLEIIQRE